MLNRMNLKPSLTVLCNHALANGIAWLHTQQKITTTLFATTASGDVITLNLDARPISDSLQYARAVLHIERAKIYTIIGLMRGNNAQEILFALAGDAGMAVYSCADVRRTKDGNVVAITPAGFANVGDNPLAELLRPSANDPKEIEAVNIHWQQHRTAATTTPPHVPH